jgi:alkyl hydroperoxide reductase subunit AhpC
MIELGQLEAHHEEFAKRGIRVYAISNDNEHFAKMTQAKFPHLVIVSDTEQNIAKAMDVIHAGQGDDGGDTNAPTTFLVDGTGQVRWLYRPDRITDRLSPAQLLAAIDTAGLSLGTP